MLIIYIIIFFIGASLASFIQVFAERLYYQYSLLYPHSFCFHCHKKIKYYDLIPICSYFILKGRCRYCHYPICKTTPCLEISSGLVALWAYTQLPTNKWAFICLLWCEFIFIFQTDLQDKSIYIVPILINTLLMIISNYHHLQLISCFLITNFMLIYMYLSKNGIGSGDILIIAQVSLFLSWQIILFGIVIACALCILSFEYFYPKEKINAQKIPFIPFLIIGWIISFLSYHYLI